MNKKTYCEHCDTRVTYSIKDEFEKDHLKGFDIEYIAKYAYCNICNEEIYIEAIDDINIATMNNIYREKANIISIDEIEEILKKHNIGASKLSVLLGWDKCTIPNYFKGEVPSICNSNKLKDILNAK